jgi:hypothetical protein
MKCLWKNEDEYDGCILSEHEAELLFKLAGKLSLNELIEKGFSHEESRTIQLWYSAISTEYEYDAEQTEDGSVMSDDFFEEAFLNRMGG